MSIANPNTPQYLRVLYDRESYSNEELIEALEYFASREVSYQKFKEIMPKNFLDFAVKEGSEEFKMVSAAIEAGDVEGISSSNSQRFFYYRYKIKGVVYDVVFGSDFMDVSRVWKGNL